MAQTWSLEIARDLIRQWCDMRVEEAVDLEGLTVKLEALESFILEQKPGSLEEAERLLDMIGLFDNQRPSDPGGLCALNGYGRNDVGRGGSRVEVSFAPRAFGPIVGRA
jgi:hypothetical protein